MCDIADELMATVKLGRAEAEWSLHVILPPHGRARAWRAVAYTFAGVDELDIHARPITEWLASVR